MDNAWVAFIVIALAVCVGELLSEAVLFVPIYFRLRKQAKKMQQTLLRLESMEAKVDDSQK